MRVLIVTAGSRGDVAPYTGLGQRLRDVGHEVTLAAHDLFADLVRGCGLEHRSLPGDPVEMVRARTAAPSPDDARSVFDAYLERLGDGLASVAGGADVLLTAFGPAPLSRLVAEGLGIPSIGVYLVPGVPTREFPPPGLPPGGPTPAGNLASGRAMLAHTAALYAGILPRLRTRLGLPASSPEHTDGQVPAGWPIIHGFSPAVLPRPADWPDHVQVGGYWWPARPVGWEPPAELLDFLDAGPPPVFVGFGSMVPERGERLGDLVEAAVGRVGVRAVVQAGWAGLGERGGSGCRGGNGGDILPIGDVPHDWLFPRTAAVVHHAGAGTTGAGIRAGVPAVAVPVLIDQPFWAGRLHDLGVAPPPVPMSELSADTLTDALRSCFERPAYRDRAAGLADRIRAEDGAAAVLAQLARLG